MKDFFSGLIFLIIGLLFLIYSNFYDLGSSTSFGPGFFPLLISSILILVGVFLIIKQVLWKH